MKVMGIDEAGRGPVLGSMFVCGFESTEEELKELEKMGLKDSKKLSDSKRESLREKLEDIGDYHVEEVTASQIDELRQVQSINKIELETFVKIINKRQPGKVIIDLPEPNSERYVRKVRKELEDQEIEIIAEHEADDNYPIVSAASIVAKSEREKHVRKLKQKYGVDFKSGYPHEQATQDFLRNYLDEKGELPQETRESWSTAKRIREESEQERL